MGKYIYIYVTTFSIKEKKLSDTNEIYMYVIYTLLCFDFIKFINNKVILKNENRERVLCVSHI